MGKHPIGLADGIGFRTVRTVPEKTQRRQRPLQRSRPRDESALYPHGVCRQGEAGGHYAGRPIWRGLVLHEPVGRIRLMQKVQNDSR